MLPYFFPLTWLLLLWKQHVICNYLTLEGVYCDVAALTLDKKAPSFKWGRNQTLRPGFQREWDGRWRVLRQPHSHHSTSQKLTAADHDAVGYPCKRLVPATCSLLHNYSYRDFHSHQDPWSCTLSPHSCVVQRICRPDDRITFDTRTADECTGHDTHPRARAPC